MVLFLLYTFRKGGFIITYSGLNLNYTAEMEKAMQQSHGMGYAEYSSKLDKQLTVEQRRQQSYEESQRIVATLDRQLHR